MQRIGLTGGIASGKSTIAEHFRAAGVPVIDADQIARQLLEPDQDGWRALANAFGARFFNSDGSVNRSRLRKAIFHDDGIRATVNRLIHPLVRRMIHQQIDLLSDSASGLVVVEVPLLYEARWQGDFSKVVVVFVEKEVQIMRLVKRDGISVNEAEKVLAAQFDLKDKVAQADYVIDNSGLWEETLLQVERLINQFSV
ncbi:MAG: dephospho-CoA kinase [Proteobacteria bacterium]|nr:dephospho-CoA kinase [Pseudomonadota bacterium]MBU1686661.1 dephospho-CoA kinase [Pseudomonadota bacterium]